MKFICLIICSTMLLCAALHAEKAGIVKFVLGDVKYKANANAVFTKLNLNDAMLMEGTLMTGLDSEVQILWMDNSTSLVKAKQTATLRALFEQSHKNSAWPNRLQDKVLQLSLDNKQKAATTAGVRRDEAVVKSQSELYWDMEPLVSLDTAIELFQANDYAGAIPLFLKVIEQGPLQRDAEYARGFLIISYEKTGDAKNKDLQMRKLQEDFPKSQLLENPETKAQ